MNIETVYKAMMKTATTFTNYGAGAAANNMLNAYEARKSELDKLLANPQLKNDSSLLITSPSAREYLSNAMERQMMPERDELEKAYSGWVNKAKVPTALAAGGAGLGAAGLTYAGLGMIPALKKKRLARILASLAVGVPAGAVAGHYTGKAVFNNQLEKIRNS